MRSSLVADEACACPDMPCAENVQVKLMDLVKDAKEPSKSDQATIMKSMERMGECMAKIPQPAINPVASAAECAKAEQGDRRTSKSRNAGIRCARAARAPYGVPLTECHPSPTGGKGRPHGVPLRGAVVPRRGATRPVSSCHRPERPPAWWVLRGVAMLPQM